MFLVQAPNLSERLVRNQVHSMVDLGLKTTGKTVSSLVTGKDLAKGKKIEAFEIDCLYLGVHFHFCVTSWPVNHQKE